MGCKHVLVHCGNCDVVKCKKCGRKWGEKEQIATYYPIYVGRPIYPVYPYPTYPYVPTWIGTPTFGQAVGSGSTTDMASSSVVSVMM